MHDLDDEEKQRALKMLQNIKHDGTTVASIKKILQDTVPAHSHQIGSFTKIKNFFEEIYHKLTNKPWFAKRLILFFSIISIVNLVESIINISTTSGFFEWGELITSGASGIIVVIGIYWMRINRIVTYKIFKIAVMISIFLTQFFRFYQQQLVAVVGLMISIFIVGSLQYLILQESTRTNKSVIKK
jgi:hypothetical protein